MDTRLFDWSVSFVGCNNNMTFIKASDNLPGRLDAMLCHLNGLPAPDVGLVNLLDHSRCDVLMDVASLRSDHIFTCPSSHHGEDTFEFTIIEYTFHIGSC